ncbi:sodium/calcium exchanger regulatory protein 1 isoform X2 [Athalia rosae]|uniref:sodium/calcium exchanger regulatory protein 1 isoform X2 n=1 Tax=Athalia rosae TaxID=37344 RepID=UPI002033D565|nr:sodium/calcium exchanger regulatory protein 1 isoform X2 [Athalia rosae]
MSNITGAYAHERNENLDEYLKAIGVPYVGRKMMSFSSPRLEISKNEDKWTIRSISVGRTLEMTFALGVEYEESMPSGDKLKNVTTIEGDSLVTNSVAPNGSLITRRYDFTPETAVLFRS